MESSHCGVGEKKKKKKEIRTCQNEWKLLENITFKQYLKAINTQRRHMSRNKNIAEKNDFSNLNGRVKYAIYLINMTYLYP